MKNKQFWYNLLYFGLILIVVLGIIFMVVWLKSIGGQCVTDPIEFYMSKSNQYCTCFVPQ